MSQPAEAGREPSAFALTGNLWRRLLPALLPAVLIGYLANLLLVLLRPAGEPAPGQLANELLRAGLWLGASWLGQLWAAALVSAALAGGEVSARVAWRALGRAGLTAWLGGALRAVVVYTPLAGLAAVALRFPWRAEVGHANVLPLAVLLLVPLSVCLGALGAPAAAVALNEAPRSSLALLDRSRQLADEWFSGFLVGGGALVIACAATSLLPVGGGLLFPNHALGSVLWVYLAVGYARAARLTPPPAEP